MSRLIVAFAALMTLLGVSIGAHAAMITTTLGNDTPGFNDGDVPTILQLIAAQGGQPAPFNAGIGNEVLGPDFSASWTFNYGALVDPILSADITIGIADHDSAATGSQLLLFDVDGTTMTAGLDTLFEAGGGATDGEYNVYALTLPGSAFAALADGSALVQLDLQGPGLVTPLFPLPGPNPPVDSAFNGAHLIFSQLEITTQDAQQLPEPPAWALLVLGLGTVSWYRRRLAVGTRRHPSA